MVWYGITLILGLGGLSVVVCFVLFFVLGLGSGSGLGGTMRGGGGGGSIRLVGYWGCFRCFDLRFGIGLRLGIRIRIRVYHQGYRKTKSTC